MDRIQNGDQILTIFLLNPNIIFSSFISSQDLSDLTAAAQRYAKTKFPRAAIKTFEEVLLFEEFYKQFNSFVVDTRAV
jgi:hypothetical protein